MKLLRLVATLLFAAIAVSLIRGEATNQAVAELDRQGQPLKRVQKFGEVPATGGIAGESRRELQQQRRELPNTFCVHAAFLHSLPFPEATVKSPYRQRRLLNTFICCMVLFSPFIRSITITAPANSRCLAAAAG